MTVIAWDGRTLAADKMCADDWTARRVTKIRRLRGGEVIAGASGAADRCRALMAWLDAGGEFPAHLRTADQTHATVLAIFRDGRRVALYQREPEPIWLDNDTPHAIGSGAEAALALLLANGYTLDEAAVELKIRKNTIRAHLRSIFAKTGVRRQTTLIHLLLNSVASIS